jgi:hypothetical protein
MTRHLTADKTSNLKVDFVRRRRIIRFIQSPVYINGVPFPQSKDQTTFSGLNVIQEDPSSFFFEAA